MAVLEYRGPVAPGAISQPTPRPALPNVDDAQQFYLSGPYAGTTSSAFGYFQNVVVGQVCYVESEQGGLALLLDKVTGELGRLLQLRPGWDGHRARQITHEAVFATARVLARVLDRHSEIPQFFPLADGGIQVEWYADEQIEIEIDGAGDAHVLATAANGEVVAEGSFDPQGSSDLVSSIAAMVRSLSAHVAVERQRM